MTQDARTAFITAMVSLGVSLPASIISATVIATSRRAAPSPVVQVASEPPGITTPPPEKPRPAPQRACRVPSRDLFGGDPLADGRYPPEFGATGQLQAANYIRAIQSLDPYTSSEQLAALPYDHRAAFNKAARQLGDGGLPILEPTVFWGDGFDLVGIDGYERGKLLASLWLPSAGTATFDMLDERRMLRFRIQMGAEPRMQFRDVLGKTRIVMGLDAVTGDGCLVFLDREGNETLRLPRSSRHR